MVLFMYIRGGMSVRYQIIWPFSSVLPGQMHALGDSSHARFTELLQSMPLSGVRAQFLT